MKLIDLISLISTIIALSFIGGLWILMRKYK